MTVVKTFYEILGLLNDADDVVIKAAYRALAQKYHPDKHKTNKEIHTQMMSNLNEAFAAIGTKSKRKAYDESLQKISKPKKTKPASPAPNTNDELIEKLEHSAMDEMVVVALFEKVFSKSLLINSGWINTYSYKNGKQKETLSFTELKLKIIEKLKQ
jgi:curved DNA-binding protein CbpA